MKNINYLEDNYSIFPDISAQKIRMTLFDHKTLNEFTNLKLKYDTLQSDTSATDAVYIKQLKEKIKNLRKKIVTGMIIAIKTNEKTLKGNGVWRINKVAAEKGFGPLLYESVMHEIYEDWLAPDAVAISFYAKNIWRNYYERTDIEKELVPAGIVKHFPEDIFLHYYYRLKSRKNTSSLKKLYNKHLNKKIKNAQEFFEILGDIYFSIRYHQSGSID